MRLSLPASCLALAGLALAACGQSGALYLPDPNNPAAQPAAAAAPAPVAEPSPEEKKDEAIPSTAPTPAPSTP